MAGKFRTNTDIVRKIFPWPLSAAERAELEARAGADEFSMAEYARRKVFAGKWITKAKTAAK